MIYNAKFETASDGSIQVRFPDIPEALTFGRNEQEAKLHARDALTTALEMYAEDSQPYPKPRYRSGYPIQVRGLHAAKLALHSAMREQGLSKADLCRLLSIHPPQVDRLLDFQHASRLNALEDALAALGKKLVIDIQAA